MVLYFAPLSVVVSDVVPLSLCPRADEQASSQLEVAIRVPLPTTVTMLELKSNMKKEENCIPWRKR